MNSDHVVIYTDGAARGNPGPGGWGAVVVEGGSVTELGAGAKHTTNNRMELTAAIEGLRAVKSTQQMIVLYTDSAYVVNGITKWVAGWQARGWKTTQKEDVLNRDLWEALIEAAQGKQVTWRQIEGHAGLVGNERVDAIATAYADGVDAGLYRGAYDAYGHDLSDTSYDEKKRAQKKHSKGRPGKAYSYVSFVRGTFMRHQSWAECEKRVKGQKGAKFKKTFSAHEERELEKEWTGR